MAAGAVVFSVSRDNLASRDKFKQDSRLPTEVDCRHRRRSCATCLAWSEQDRNTAEGQGIRRSTFLIDPKGVLREEWRGIKVAGHVLTYKAVQAWVRLRLVNDTLQCKAAKCLLFGMQRNHKRKHVLHRRHLLATEGELMHNHFACT